MAREIKLNITAVNIAKLDEEMRGVVPGFAGIRTEPGAKGEPRTIYAILEDNAPQESAAQAVSLSLAHDPLAKSQAEIDDDSRRADLDEVRSAKLQNALDSIADDIALLPTATNQQLREILERDLRRQRFILKALARLV